MAYARKVVMSADSDYPMKEDVKDKIYGKMYKTVDIIAKLADIKGYDKTYRIQTSDGSYMPNSNLITLITHAMSSGRVLYGEQEFIELLHKAGVEPELILNDNVRSKLIAFYNQPTENFKGQTTVTENRQSIKRSFDDEDDDEYNNDRPAKKQRTVAVVNPTRKRPVEEVETINWQYPDGEK
jgi:hypothetical protein